MHEVLAVRGAAQAAVDRLGRAAQQRVAPLQHAARDAGPQRAVRGRELHRDGDEDDELQRLEQRRHPGVQALVAQAVEGFPEGQVADHVERVPAEPWRQVHIAAGGSRDLGAQADEEVVDVRLEEGFLLAEGFVREGVGEDAAQARVVGVRGGDDAVNADEEAQVLGEGLPPRDLRVHVVPGGRGREGQLVGRGAHHVRVVGRVQRVQPAGEVSGQGGVRDGELGGGGEAGAREGG